MKTKNLKALAKAARAFLAKYGTAQERRRYFNAARFDAETAEADQ